MSVLVFVGPTLPVEDARAVLDAEYLPPASLGDVYRAARRRPRAIGIVDGYFHWVPAVWHKEILWALSRGIPVFGSASMGALRAAELAPFGMTGVGRIFEAYRSGEIEDDDEVALLHASDPVRGEYLGFTDPMVNIRETLRRARTEGVVGERTRRELEALAKGLYYGERTYEAVLRLAEERGTLAAAELARLRAWLPQNRVDQKRLDAIEMLETMHEHLCGDGRGDAPAFSFEPTELWHQLCTRTRLREASAAAATGRSTGGNGHDAGGASADVRRQALLRWLLLDRARRDGVTADDAEVERTILEFRSERGLLEPDDLTAWLDERELTLPEFLRIMEDEAKIRRLEAWLRLDSMPALVDVVRLRVR